MENYSLTKDQANVISSVTSPSASIPQSKSDLVVLKNEANQMKNKTTNVEKEISIPTRTSTHGNLHLNLTMI